MSSARFAAIVFSLFLAVIGCNTQAVAADSPFSLEVIQPRAGLTTANRFYKAYPGLVYNVRAGVTGGVYPYQFALTTAPSGMSVNATTGEISWPSPQAQSSAYPVTLQVTDSAGVSRTVSWSVLVTTQKFLFVDAVNGKDGATGTINDPVRTFVDVYGGTDYASKWATKMKDYFVYFKNGTYAVAGYPAGAAAIQWTSGQPVVFLAYPGHAPAFDMTSSMLKAETKLDNFYLDGFDVKNILGPVEQESRNAFKLTGSSSDVTIRKSSFHNLAASSGSYNQSAVMLTRDDTSGAYWSIQDNYFYDIHQGYGILGYNTNRTLIEDNRFDNIDGHNIGLKEGTSYWFVRHNRITNASVTGIWLYGNKHPSVASIVFANNEISYNYVSMKSGADNNALWVNQYGQDSGSAYFFRNTLVGNVLFNQVGGNVGPYSLTKNVITNAASTTGGYTCTSCAAPSNIVANNNLLGSASAGIVDANGLLTSTNSAYVGLRGWQLGTVSPPSAPLLIVK